MRTPPPRAAPIGGPPAGLAPAPPPCGASLLGVVVLWGLWRCVLAASCSHSIADELVGYHTRLPTTATGIDFNSIRSTIGLIRPDSIDARQFFQVHSELGERCTRAEVVVGLKNKRGPQSQTGRAHPTTAAAPNTSNAATNNALFASAFEAPSDLTEKKIASPPSPLLFFLGLRGRLHGVIRGPRPQVWPVAAPQPSIDPRAQATSHLRAAVGYATHGAFRGWWWLCC